MSYRGREQGARRSGVGRGGWSVWLRVCAIQWGKVWGDGGRKLCAYAGGKVVLAGGGGGGCGRMRGSRSQRSVKG